MNRMTDSTFHTHVSNHPRLGHFGKASVVGSRVGTCELGIIGLWFRFYEMNIFEVSPTYCLYFYS